MVLKGLEAYTTEQQAGPLGAEIVGVFDNIAKRYLLLKHYAEAEAAYQKVLSLWLENTYYDADRMRKLSAGIYHQLGWVAQEQRQFQQAEQYFQQALPIFIDFNDRNDHAGILHHLGMVAQEQRKFQQAEQYFQQALQIYIDFNDRYAQASTLHQLGRVAQEQRQWDKARDQFLQALTIFVEYNDTYARDIVTGSLARLWKESADATILPAVTSILDLAPDEVEKTFRQIRGDEAASDTP